MKDLDAPHIIFIYSLAQKQNKNYLPPLIYEHNCVRPLVNMKLS